MMDKTMVGSSLLITLTVLIKVPKQAAKEV
jgi:hypothetical protein